MNNIIKTFRNEELGINIRTVEINGEPLFIGKDLVRALGYELNGKNVPSTYIKRHCDAEDIVVINKNSLLHQKGVFDYRILGQRGGYLITESGMYALILGSQLEEAKKFKRWVTKDVLPAIRKYGLYATDNTVDMILNNPDTIIQVLNAYKQEKSERERIAKENEKLLLEAEENQEKIIAYNDFINSDGLYDFAVAAKILNIPRTAYSNNVVGKNTLMLWLRRDEVLIATGKNRNTPYQRYINQGLFKMKASIDKNNESKSVVLVTPKGIEWLYKKYKHSNMPTRFDKSLLTDDIVEDTDIAL